MGSKGQKQLLAEIVKDFFFQFLYDFYLARYHKTRNKLAILMWVISPGHVQWIVFYPFFKIENYPKKRIENYPKNRIENYPKKKDRKLSIAHGQGLNLRIPTCLV